MSMVFLQLRVVSVLVVEIIRLGSYANWWSSTVILQLLPGTVIYLCNAANVNRFNGNKLNGYSVRCVKD